MIKYLSKNLWSKIKMLSENANDNIIVVSPYVGNNIEEIIHFAENDTLITSLTKNNVQQGNVNPNSIEGLINKNIKIFSIENLHSKIYYFKKSVIVSSSNLSNNSKNNLFESGIWTDDKDVIERIEKDLEILQKEEITLEFIQALKEHYTPPRSTNRRGNSKPQSTNIWIISTLDSEFTKEELKLLEDKNEEYELLIREGHKISDIRFNIDNSFINEVEIGERVIEVDYNKQILYMPKKVIGIELGPNNRGRVKSKFLRLESEKKDKSCDIIKMKKDLNLRMNFQNIQTKLIQSQKIKIVSYLKKYSL